ncbi:MAG: YhjD/YihY/BrkB family envelope integrity protein [Lentisphaeria bacterium]
MITEFILNIRRRIYAILRLWNTEQLSRLKIWLIRCFQVIAVSIYKLRHDNCILQAAALSYITVIAVIPIFALAFAILNAFGAQQHLINILEEGMANYPEQFVSVIHQVTDTIRNANYGALGAVGALIILFMAVRLLSRIEKTFNTIWETAFNRPTLRRLADYVTVIILVPFLLITATSAGTFLASDRLETYLTEQFGFLVFIYHVFVASTGFMAVILGLMFLYLLMPNTRVRLRPAFTGALVAGILWTITQWLYISFQIGVTRLNPVYGSFAAVPLFLGWIFISWVIVLIGAEVGFAVQNHVHFVKDVFGDEDEESPISRENLALLIFYDIGQHFLRGKSNWSLAEFAGKQQLSHNIILELISNLRQANLLAAIDEERDQYVPGHDLSTITVADVINAVRGGEGESVQTFFRNTAPAFYERLSKFRNRSNQELNKLNFRDLLQEENAT